MEKSLGKAGAVAVAFGKSIDGLVCDAGEEAGLDRFFNRIGFC